MTRNHSAMSLTTSCLGVPINPYSQQPSPSYERRQIVTLNMEEESSFLRKSCPTSASSRPASSMNSPTSKEGVTLKRVRKTIKPQCTSSSPLDSFLDFYESIPDYQDVTHLSDKEFAEKMKLLRNKQRQYLNGLGRRYSPIDYEESQGNTTSYEKKACKSINKLELAKEWVNKSCDSLSSVGKKSDDYRIRSVVDNQSKMVSSANESPRKYDQYDRKDDAEGLLMDTGSSLSADSNVLKSKLMRTNFTVEEDAKPTTSTPTQDCNTPFTSTGRSETSQGISSFYNLKDNPVRNYDFYNLKGITLDGHTSLSQKKSQTLYGLQSSGTSELNVQDCSSPVGLSQHEALSYEDYYVPTFGWVQSDSDSMLGTMNHIPSTRPSTAMVSQSLLGSPTSKVPSSSSKSCTSKKKNRRKKKTSQKSVTKPIPFSFMCNDRQYSRSTPDLSNHCRSPSPKHFRARPIPRNLFSSYVYRKKQEEEFFRALKRKVRAEDMLRAASLPPSMEFRERLTRVQAEAAAAEAASLVAVSCSSEQSSEQSGVGAGGGTGEGEGDGLASGRVVRPARGGRVRRGRPRRPPDFAKCHEKIGQELYDRQGRNITTSPSPYALRLRTASLSPRRKASSSSGSDSRRCRPRSKTELSTTCRSNLAALLRAQTARQRLDAEHHRLCEEQMRRAEMKLKERLTRLTPAWRTIRYSTEDSEEDLALRAAARRKEEREQRREHGVLMRHMLNRVHTIPTLFQRQSTSLSANSLRRSACGTDQCGPNCPVQAYLDDDEDASDVKVFVESQARRHIGLSSRPSRPRQRERPFSAGARTGAGRSATESPDKQPDQMTSNLRTYHRQLPLSRLTHPHRVEFSDSPVHQDEDGEEEDRDVVAASGEVEVDAEG